MSRPAVSLFQRTGETGEIGKFNYEGRRERERGAVLESQVTVCTSFSF